ncbi:MAG: DNA mismatch endonuclease Vsr [Armatimonadetes bacterium]|nr:DNA mismatch endonuclease Vsr [Armatimonadota bacterium]
MADRVDPQTRSRVMASVRSTNTSPEMAVRRAIHAAGFRYRLHAKDLPGKPDLVFPRFRIALFVHGCFWHWHGCTHSRMPATRQEYWIPKIARNTERDREAQAKLTALGWECRVVWECDLPAGTATFIADLQARRHPSAPESHPPQ